MLNVTSKDEITSSSRLLPALEKPCSCFSMAELSSATNNFDEKCIIGQGGFGNVYKGKITDGHTYICAIKRLNFMSKQGAAEFWVEVEMLSRLRHCNIVPLIGYCYEGKEMALVYEYMPNGTLYDHLHKKATVLTWSEWLKICIGAARGLDYLHTGTGTQKGVIHRDVKSANILLDQSYAAKIADFGLAKIGSINQTHTFVSTAIKGSFGYMDPTYASTGRLTRKSDVYSFGVVLLEVLCGRPALDKRLDEGLAVWAQCLIKQGKLNQIINHARLRDRIVKSSMKEFSSIAVRCVLSSPNQRPTMTEVVGALDRALSFQERNTSSQGGIDMKNAWSFFSIKDHFKPRISGTAESKDKNVSIPVLSPVAEVDEDQRETRERQDDNQLKSSLVITSYLIPPVDMSSSASTLGSLGPTELFPENKEPIRVSNRDDGYLDNNSLDGGGGYVPSQEVDVDQRPPLEAQDGNQSKLNIDTPSSAYTLGPTETSTVVAEISKSLLISNADDRYTNPNSHNDSGGSGVELGTKYMSDHVPSEEGGYSGLNTRDPAYDSSNNAAVQVKAEWIEQYEPGVYITLLALPDGTNGLKRLSFSRKRFSENKADTWWSENNEKVYERYNAIRPVPSLVSEVKANEQEPIEGQDEDCSKSNQVIETVTRLTGIKEPIRISNGDDGYSESNSLNGSGCSGVELGTKYMSDHVPSEEGGYSGLNTRDPAYDSSNNAAVQVKAEWVEQYEPGVFITLLALPDGINGLKGLRFSRRRFSENQAETWWSENKKKVYERYNAIL